MSKKQNIEVYNEEVKEIMKEIPGRLIRWGLTIIFLIFISVIVGSYFFTFTEIVSAPLVITTTNPPAPLISKSSGRIARWFVSDGQIVHEDDWVALINNSANLEDIIAAENVINRLDSANIQNDSGKILMPQNLALGDLQESYNELYRNIENYSDYMENSYLPRKIDLLKQQMVKQEQQYQLSLEQKKMMEQELDITKNGLERYKSMLNKGGVSESQLEEEKARVIQSERGYTSFLASLKSTEINLIAQKRSLLELEEQRHNEIEKFKLTISDNLKTLKSLIKNWKETYLLSSPIKGKVTLTTFWSENHVISAGERLATVVPVDSSVIICRSVVPSSGIGKVETGQDVHIKLSGYPYIEHGILTGKVSTISLVPDKEGYIVEITLNEGMVSSYSEQLKLVQEMEGTAEIITKKMRMIYRFINPLKMILND